MRRACQTAQGVASAVKGCRFEVLPTLCEVGGMYRVQRAESSATGGGGSPEFVRVPASGMAGEDFQQQFPQFDLGRIPDRGPWDEGRGHEVTPSSPRQS